MRQAVALPPIRRSGPRAAERPDGMVVQSMPNLTVPNLTPDEAVTLRRVAFGQSEVRAMRPADLMRLRRIGLIADAKDGPQLTRAGKLVFDSLPKAAVLETPGHMDELMKSIGQSVPGPAGQLKTARVQRPPGPGSEQKGPRRP